jgi:hypothetical protein
VSINQVRLRLSYLHKDFAFTVWLIVHIAFGLATMGFGFLTIFFGLGVVKVYCILLETGANLAFFHRELSYIAFRGGGKPINWLLLQCKLQYVFSFTELQCSLYIMGG